MFSPPAPRRPRTSSEPVLQILSRARPPEIHFSTPPKLSRRKNRRDPARGRLDAVHRGGNLLLAVPLVELKNYAPTTAPVRFPALWDTPYFDWVLYNASIRQPLARNVIEALGVGAPIDPTTFLSDRIAHGVLMDNVVAVHRALTKLRAPRWPADVFGDIDFDKARQGETIYRQTCAGCHVGRSGDAYHACRYRLPRSR